MGLKGCDMKHKYDSDIDDMIIDFYNPVLSESFRYYRLSGFFSSSVLAVVARGMEEFIKNDGKMYLICSAILPEKDIEVIKESVNNNSSLLENHLIKSLNDIEKGFIEDHVYALAWMLAKGNLKIKIAVISDKGVGMFHQKIGILKDDEGNAISFSGSNNETAAGLKYNIEDFKVFKSWDEGQKGYFEDDFNAFCKYWNDESKRMDIIDLPEAVAREIIKKAPRNIDDLDLKKYASKNVSRKIGIGIKDPKEEKKEIKLREYQEKAISKWFENGKRGIFEMATGTGKTFTALACFDRTIKEDDNLVTVIAAPQSHLLDQWIKDVKKFYNGRIIIASGKNPKWRSQIKGLINNFYLGIEKNIVIITTHKTLSNNDLIESIRKFKAKKLLVVDEVHGIGSSKQLIALDDSYDYRLGLSATPTRWFDEEGTDYIMDYFGGVVFEFDIGKALNTINPDTGKYYLTPYIYKPILVDLNNEELQQYVVLSLQIANILKKKKKNRDKLKLQQLCFKRQRIINNAEDKYDKLIEILDENEDIKDLIVFCSPQQIEIVQQILNDKKITQHKFTAVEKVKKENKYGGMTEREYLIKKLEEGSYRALVAMKCLDEGVDIPSAQNAIIMSNTSNPREHIQRRGRILRQFPGKKEAKIWDMLVFPSDGSETSERIIKKEVTRYREFAVNAKNAIECIKVLDKY